MFGIPNPQFLLQPWRNLTQFTEELFAAVTSRHPVERDGPVTIRVREGETALRIVRAGGDEPGPVQRTSVRPRPAPLSWAVSPAADQARREQGRFQPPQFPVEPAAPRVTLPPIPVPPLPTQPPLQAPTPIVPPPLPSQPPLVQPPLPTPAVPPLVEIAGPVAFSGREPVRFEVPPQVFDTQRQRYFTPRAFEVPDLPGTPAFPVGGDPGTTVFIGKVQSGSGDTYQVVLYQSGPDGDPDSSAVTVTIPMIASDETIAADTWLYGIFQFTDSDGNNTYTAQPPVWMA